MSKNLRKKALAFGSMFGLVVSGVVSIPAQAAPGEVTIAPELGQTWAVFNGDSFEVDIAYPNFLDDHRFGLSLSNEDGQAFYVDFDYEGVLAFDSSGRVTNVTTNPEVVNGYIDFDDLNATKVVFTYGSGDEHVTGEKDEEGYDTDLIIRPALYDETIAGVRTYEQASFGDGDFSVSVQAWNEAGTSPNYLTVDQAWASSVEVVNFYDPKNVSLTPRIERFVTEDVLEPLSVEDAGLITNTAGSELLGYSVGFSKRVNLEQIDPSEFNLTVEFGSEESEFDLGAALVLRGDVDADDRERLYSVVNVADLVDGLTLDDEGLDELDVIWLGADGVPGGTGANADFLGATYVSFASDFDSVAEIIDVENAIEAEEEAIENISESIAFLQEVLENAPADKLAAQRLTLELAVAQNLVALKIAEILEAEEYFYDAGNDITITSTDDIDRDRDGFDDPTVRVFDASADATPEAGEATQGEVDAQIAAINVLYAQLALLWSEVAIVQADIDGIRDFYVDAFETVTPVVADTADYIEDVVSAIGELPNASATPPVSGAGFLLDAASALAIAEDNLPRLEDTLELLESIYTSVLGVDIPEELAAGQTYRIGVQHEDADEERDRNFVSPRFVVPGGSEDATDVTLTVGDAANSNQEDEIIDLRVGTKSYTYTAQLVNDAEVAVKEAGVPVMLAVYATGWAASNAATPAVLSASGSNVEITGIDGAMIATGVTNASGQATFTITHSLAAAGDSYEIYPYFADEDGRATEAGLVYEASYAATAPAEIEADNSVVAGANITITFTVTDQFGNPVSTLGTRALNVELTATDADDLELTAAVGANGKATFTFANFLAKGERDVLSASVFTGSGTTANFLGLTPALVELYNTADVASVEVAASANAVVTYSDFITGEGTAATRPANADGTLYSGTVLDANGAGVAGAVVTVSGNGFQFRKADSGDYATNSINVVADTNGQFSVRFWVHEANSTGKTLTVTSGGKSATTTVKSYLPEALSGANLSFSWTLPTVVVKNTTYAVVAKLTDKWGNPVSTTGSTTNGVTFQGTGSVEVNSLATPVARNFGKDGTVTVFLRSVKDVAGPGELTAVLAAADYTGTLDGSGTLTNLGAITTNNTATAWDETKWSRELSASIEVLDQAPAPTGKVNVGSFNGKLVVYAAGLAGQTISWKVAGKWGKAVASSDYVRFDRPTARVGVDVIVEIYVNGVKQLTKTVRTR